jgi:hypothetical protein
VFCFYKNADSISHKFPAQAEAQANITAAQRKITLEEQTTETEIARRVAERES